MKFLFLCLVLFSGSAQASDRTAYVEEAGREIGFYFEFLGSSPAFQKQMTAKEKDHLREIQKIVSELPGGPKFVYSDNPDDFILNPGEPERSAKTTEVLTDPIWINTRKLNMDSGEIDYLTVVQLLVHELGHKLAEKKIQAVVDSLAAKIHDTLKTYYSVDSVYYIPGMGPPRPLRENFELLSLPKQIRASNANPTLFYRTEEKIWPINLQFKDSLKNQNGEKFVRVHRVKGETQADGILYVDVALSLAKKFKTPDSGFVYANEGSYKFFEPMPFDFDKSPMDSNFRMSRIKLSYQSADLDNSVQKLKEMARTSDEVSFLVDFQFSQKPKNIALIAGTIDRSFLIPCEVASGASDGFSTKCHFKLPKKTAISILHVLQLLVDGQVLDLPEIYNLDLEQDFSIPMDMSDTEPTKIKTINTSEGKAYELSMKGTWEPIQVRVRCLEEEDFIYGGERLGTVDRFVERVFFSGELPVEKLTGKNYKVTATCKKGLPLEILITDGLLYTSSPHWN